MSLDVTVARAEGRGVPRSLQLSVTLHFLARDALLFNVRSTIKYNIQVLTEVRERRSVTSDLEETKARN
jgi:hypothetical protein